MSTEGNNWFVFNGTKKSKETVDFPKAPPWRRGRESNTNVYIPDTKSKELEIVNAGIYLKRPILITGSPGVGKSSLAYAIAYELGLDIIKWEITSKSTLKDALYSYDAIARLQDASLKKEDKSIDTNINNYLFLGPLGYAFATSEKPKVLLIDEIDKSDIDLPNDLLHIFEEMEFVIPELERADRDGQGINIYPNHIKKAQSEKAIRIQNGKVRCNPDLFPIVVMTSNNEREFSAAFLRRCLRLDMRAPDKERLLQIIRAHFKNIPQEESENIDKIIIKFLDLIKNENFKLSTDQLLNAIHLLFEKEINLLDSQILEESLFKSLE